MRLIDADAWMKKLGMAKECDQCTSETYKRRLTYTFCDICDCIRCAPIIEPKRGEWIPHPTEKEWDVCTACGTGCKRREIGYDTYFQMTYVTEYGYPFCPNCGADMRGE